jgi:hypothetical protein
VFITGTPAQTTYDAPGGINPADPPGCNAVVPASGNVELTVTVRYLYQPMTPMVAALIGNSLIISASSTMRTEY